MIKRIASDKKRGFKASVWGLKSPEHGLGINMGKILKSK